MPSTEERIRRLVEEYLVVEGRPTGKALDPNSSLRDTGASSMAIVAFLVKLLQEFELDIAPEEFAQVPNIQGLIDLIESRTG